MMISGINTHQPARSMRSVGDEFEQSMLAINRMHPAIWMRFAQIGFQETLPTVNTIQPASWIKTLNQDIMQLMTFHASFQVGLMTAFAHIRRCDLWWLPSTLSFFVSAITLLRVTEKLVEKWQIRNKIKIAELDLESQITQVASKGISVDIVFVLIYIVISGISALSFRMIFC